jgi:prepilin-type N-terminal cleavage/methylation domain-containing protein
MSSILKKAFTLIELLVVIAIIGILSGLIIVGMNGMTRQASIAKSQIFNNSLRNSLMNNVAADIPLDGSAEDIWNHNTSITTIATPTAQANSNCIQNTCYSFDGTGAFLLADNAKYVVTNQMTAMVWVKGASQASKAVFSHWGASGQREWAILSGASNGYLEVIISDDGIASTKDRTSTSAAPFDGNWHLVGFTLAAGTTGNLTLYVDGVSAAAGGTDGTITAIDDTTTSALALACTPSAATTCTAGTYFTGLLDSARFYDVVIPTSQIKELYFAGLNNLFAKGQITTQEYAERIISVGINN